MSVRCWGTADRLRCRAELARVPVDRSVEASDSQERISPADLVAWMGASACGITNCHRLTTRTIPRSMQTGTWRGAWNVIPQFSRLRGVFWPDK